jgi:hypothetical protein
MKPQINLIEKPSIEERRRRNENRRNGYHMANQRITGGTEASLRQNNTA